MQVLRWVETVPHDGRLDLHVRIPSRFGGKVEVIVLPFGADSAVEPEEALTSEEAYLAAAYSAVVEEDPEEDEIWSRYLE